MPPDQRRQEDLEWRARVREEDLAWREQSRRKEFEWREQHRQEEQAWRSEARDLADEARGREAMAATRRFALLAAAQSAGSGTAPEDVFALAARYEAWINGE